MIIQWHENFLTADVAFLLIATTIQLAIVWPALTLVYGALSGRKDLLQHTADLPRLLVILSFTWCFWAFSLAFAPGPGTVPLPDPDPSAHVPKSFQEIMEIEDGQKDETANQGRGGFVGGSDYLNLRSHSPVSGTRRPVFASRRPFHQVPHILFLSFHMMLFVAAPTPLLILMLTRIRLVGILLFAVLWGTTVYSPLVHWVWGDGWLESLGVIDSAGGLLHVGVGFSALACAVVFRMRNMSEPSDRTVDLESAGRAATVNLAILAYWAGTALVNSALTMHADGRAAISFANTHLAASAGLIGGPVALYVIGRRSAGISGCLGAFSGLIAISPSCAMLLPQTAMITGAAAAVLSCVAAEFIQARWKGHLALLIFVFQGIAGGVGCLLAGVFATTNVAGNRWDGRLIEGAIEGNLNQISLQLLAVVTAGTWGFIGTILLFTVINFGFRLKPIDQAEI